jgi:hypothetical protein
MSADSRQVMRVLGRCLDTAEASTETDPQVAAAAARAMTDPDLHDAIAVLLVDENVTRSWSCMRRTVAALSEYRDLTNCPDRHCDAGSSVVRIVSSCQAASRASGQDDIRTARALGELFLAAIVVERSSLGTAQSRQLRNLAAHSDVTAARVLWRSLADRQREGSGQYPAESDPDQGWLDRPDPGFPNMRCRLECRTW